MPKRGDRKNKGKGVLNESERSRKPVKIPSRSSSTALPRHEPSSERSQSPLSNLPSVGSRSASTALPRHEPSSERSQNPLSNLPSVGSRSSQSADVAIEGESEPDEWDSPNVFQFGQLLSDSLHTLFCNAIKEIVNCGFSEGHALKSISRHGLYQGGEDLLSNVVKDSLDYLEKQKGAVDSSFLVMDMPTLAQYTVLEMVLVLREVHPSLPVMDAMWLLLMSELNISQACSQEFIDLILNKEVSGASSSVPTPTQSRPEAQSSKIIHPNTSEPNAAKPSTLSARGNLLEALSFGSYSNSLNVKLPQSQTGSMVNMEEIEKSAKAVQEHVQSRSLALASEEKSGTSQNAQSKKELAALQQKSSHRRIVKIDKSYRKGGAFGSGKLASFGGLSVEKKLKPLSEASVEYIKDASSKVRIERGAATNPPLTIPVSGSSSFLPTKGNISALPAANTELVVSSSLEKNPAPRAETSTPVSLKMSDDYAGIPFDESQGKHVPQENKDEQILRLATRVQDLMNELKGWDKWANQKVMQAAQRLSKDRSELKELREEKQEVLRWKLKDQILAEAAKERLSELESALNTATSTVEKSNSDIRKLEEENTLLKDKMVAAKVVAEESDARSHEALQMEQKSKKSALTWETQKGWLQVELQTEKQKVAELQSELDKATEYHKQIEVKCKQETTQKEKLLAQAASIRSERKQLEKDAKEEEGRIKLEMKEEKKKYTEDMKKLEAKVSVLKFESDSSKMAAPRDGGFGRVPPGSNSAANPATSRGKQISGLKVERECVMCLEEEMSVVFLPCAHQVLCSKCNELHEKGGMKECPSCRTPIEQRIPVRFAGQ